MRIRGRLKIYRIRHEQRTAGGLSRWISEEGEMFRADENVLDGTKCFQLTMLKYKVLMRFAIVRDAAKQAELRIVA